MNEIVPNKKHHFVSRFYFRFFSNDGKIINQYNLNRKQFNKVSIADIAQKKYFFGKNDIEKTMGPLEGKFKEVLDIIINNEMIPVINTKEMLFLLLFVTMFQTQNLKSKEKVKSTTRKLIDLKFKDYLKSQGISEEDTVSDWEITYDGDFPMMLIGGMHGFTLIQDRKIKILKTNNHSFITSDNPIVLYNLSMVKDTEFNRTGFQAPGLMIFVPINEKLCLLFYDSNVYKIQEKDKIEISDADVDEINKLQILNCINNIFFENCSQSYVETLFYEVENDISQNNDIILKNSSEINEKKLNEFLSELSAFDIAEGVLFTSYSIKKEMNFSFIEGINPPASMKFSRDRQAVKFFEITVNADFYESMVENNKINELQW